MPLATLLNGEEFWYNAKDLSRAFQDLDTNRKGG